MKSWIFVSLNSALSAFNSIFDQKISFESLICNWDRVTSTLIQVDSKPNRDRVILTLIQGVSKSNKDRVILTIIQGVSKSNREKYFYLMKYLFNDTKHNIK